MALTSSLRTDAYSSRFWEGHDFSRAVRSLKMYCASAPEANSLRLRLVIPQPARKSLVTLATVAALWFAAGCANSGSVAGKVDQGRAIAFDRQNGVVTLILDSAPKSDQPRYDVLPPVAVKLPVDPNETGPAPEAGKLLSFDTKQRTVVFFDPASGTLKTVSYLPVNEQDDVSRNDPRVAKTKFPAVDRQNKTVTIYSRRKKILLTFSVPGEYLALPGDTWKSGDEIRYYYKQPGQALRLMNVSKTDLTKAGK
ncbi:putative Lipoprotein [Candidatus Sulfotelmatobacter kueseliae]|uniref:Putative Lipoprotein n=1 Tax=Candidatus Sulfotelmatobacter kueseliae TaxID=2042962 RepID=A0A2U3K5D0_9BACT|nr:putative Lipoprotein [Candidatus Sulfotelmatobacter kueseliae]